MNDYLDALLERTLGEKPPIRPRLPAIFEPDELGTAPVPEQLLEAQVEVASAARVDAEAVRPDNSQQPLIVPTGSQTGGVQAPLAKEQTTPAGIPLQGATVQDVPSMPGSTQRMEQPTPERQDVAMGEPAEPGVQAASSLPAISTAAPEGLSADLPPGAVPLPGTASTPAGRATQPVSIRLVPVIDPGITQAEPASPPASQAAGLLAHRPEISPPAISPAELAPPPTASEYLPPALRVEPSGITLKPDETPTAPRVTIHIGRIDIRMAPQAVRTPARKPAQAQRKPVMSLDSYLKQRSGEKS